MNLQQDNPASREDDPLWNCVALHYGLHVNAFCESDGIVIGDCKGLTEKPD